MTANTKIFLDELVSALIGAAAYNELQQSRPVAVLWPDRAREWERLAPLVSERLPVLTMGPYAPGRRSGPAAWLRCMVARSLADQAGESQVPVLYLPGVSAASLEADRCSAETRLLLDLRYRGAVWAQGDGRDWTVAEFFSQPIGGLGIALVNGAPVREALARALVRLAQVPAARLHAEAPWKAADFEALVQPDRRGAPNLEDLIAQGEGPRVEFKASYRLPTGIPKVKGVELTGAELQAALRAMAETLEMEVVATVAAFLNSEEGGVLLVGVNDDGSVQGIEHDFPAFSEKDRNLDNYERHITGVLLKHFGLTHAPFFRVTLPETIGKHICRIDVDPAPQPAYCKERNVHAFYVRIGNSSRKHELPEAVTYIRHRWG